MLCTFPTALKHTCAVAGSLTHARTPQHPLHSSVDRSTAKYEIVHSVRTHIGADDDAFNAIRQREDEEGIRGIKLQRNVVPTAAQALKTNINSLAPLVLPLGDLIKCASDKEHMPNFRAVFDHFIVHTGAWGRRAWSRCVVCVCVRARAHVCARSRARAVLVRTPSTLTRPPPPTAPPLPQAAAP